MQVDSQGEFVDGAGYIHQVAEVADGAFTIARKQACGPARLPSAARRQPSRRREMMERHDSLEPIFPADRQHPPIVLELSERKLTFFGFDARPFDREAIRVEA